MQLLEELAFPGRAPPKQRDRASGALLDADERSSARRLWAYRRLADKVLPRHPERSGGAGAEFCVNSRIRRKR